MPPARKETKNLESALQYFISYVRER